MSSKDGSASDLLRRARRRSGELLKRVRHGSPDASARPASAPPRPRPVPDGWTEDDVHRVLSSLRIDDAPESELQGYLAESFWRFLHTWGLVRDQTGRGLEIGANPYFITYLVRSHTALEMTLANYFGDERREITQTVELTSLGGEPQRFDLKSDLFNMEVDPFPYETGSFDVVLFCEVIEHLIADPMHALREIRRVLAPNGLLVLTTPNAARLANVLAMVAGENIYDPYSGYGPHGRHNREYTRHEVVHLLRFAGFTVVSSFTADAHATSYDHRLRYDEVADAVSFRSEDLGQYLFVVARATHPPAAGLPSFLYRSYPADTELVDVFSYRPHDGER